MTATSGVHEAVAAFRFDPAVVTRLLTDVWPDLVHPDEKVPALSDTAGDWLAAALEAEYAT